MHKTLRSFTLIAAAFATVIDALPSMAQATGTNLVVVNTSNTPVYCVITVTDSLTPSINNIQVNGSSNWVAPPTSAPPPPTDNGLYYTCPPGSQPICGSPPVQGFFYLQNSTTNPPTGVTISSTTSGNVLSGVSISFLQPPYACPGQSNGFYPYVAEFPAPNGTNFAEVTLNVTTGEFVDISCNNGANATISMTGTGGPSWYLNGAVTPLSITNSWVNGTTGADNNCSIGGVFPYQFSRCTTGPNSCGSPAPDNTSCTNTNSPNNGPCEFSRLSGQAGGGTVTVTYTGSLQAPVSSPPPGTGTTPPPTTPPPTTPGQPVRPYPGPIKSHHLEGTQLPPASGISVPD